MPYGPTSFRSTVVKPYYTDKQQGVSREHGNKLEGDKEPGEDKELGEEDEEPGEEPEEEPKEEPKPAARRGQGRPKGLRNKKTL